MLAEQTDEWTEQRRYMGLEILGKARLTLLADDADQTTTTALPDNTAIAASSGRKKTANSLSWPTVTRAKG